ncbi:hypothetical protein [Rhizobium ruizarguesonis]|uniref:hypothetical protein n=1 Tax=Rhizobium ruizarguesonis TaxID=2081791 RepID=UPI0013EEBB6E|nr:hypothetical protein [Rhizobium ruizarguesonis]
MQQGRDGEPATRWTTANDRAVFFAYPHRLFEDFKHSPIDGQGLDEFRSNARQDVAQLTDRTAPNAKQARQRFAREDQTF